MVSPHKSILEPPLNPFSRLECAESTNSSASRLLGVQANAIPHASADGAAERSEGARDGRIIRGRFFNFSPESGYDDDSATMAAVRASPGAPRFQVLSESESLPRLVLARLERVSVDSALAHRASGIRGVLLKCLEDSERGSPVDPETLNIVLQQAFRILEEEAARITR
jgi:hypothetical protein